MSTAAPDPLGRAVQASWRHFLEAYEPLRPELYRYCRHYEVVAPPRCELRAHRGASLLLWWSGDEVHAIVRAEVDGDRIARLCSYYHAPDVLTEVCRELGVPFRTHGYRPTADHEAS